MPLTVPSAKPISCSTTLAGVRIPTAHQVSPILEDSATMEVSYLMDNSEGKIAFGGEQSRVDLMNLHEEMFARYFITSRKRDRYLTLLQTAKGRSKLVFALNHFSDLDMRYALRVSTGQQHVNAILSTLKKKGAPNLCYVLSSNSG